jgi:hypothetical protein
MLDAPDRKSDQTDHIGYESGMVYAGCSSVVGPYGVPYRIRNGVPYRIRTGVAAVRETLRCPRLSTHIPTT